MILVRMRKAMIAAGLVLVTVGCAATPVSSSAAVPTTASSAAASATATVSSASASTTTKPCGRAASAPRYDHVVWLVMENHGLDQVVGSRSAPYLNGLIARCGLATNMHAITHPSLPNYIAMTSGGTQGVADDALPSKHPVQAASIFSQLGATGWRSLSQSMPGTCRRTAYGNYVPRHNPPTYYTRLRTSCTSRAVALASVPDLSARFTFIVPNQLSNTHDTSVAYGDRWLSTFVPKLLSSPQYRASRTALFITYDEDEDNGGTNRITTVVITPSTRPGTRSSVYFTHYSLLRTTEQLLGLPPLGRAATARSMLTAFGLGVPR